MRRARQPGRSSTKCWCSKPPRHGKVDAGQDTATPDWFEENLKLGADAQEVIQQTSGKWIGEIAELAGLSNKETEVVKQMLSRGTDRAAGSTRSLPRTHQDSLYRSAPPTTISTYVTQPAIGATGPLRCGRKTSERRIKAIRDHLWGEAAYYESKVESLAWPCDLWGCSCRRPGRERDQRPPGREDRPGTRWPTRVHQSCARCGGWRATPTTTPRSNRRPCGHGSGWSWASLSEDAKWKAATGLCDMKSRMRMAPSTLS